MINRSRSRPPVDGSYKIGQDFQRFQLDLMLYFFPGFHVMLAAYVDESGTADDLPVMCVAGLLYSEQKVKQLDLDWKQALDWAGVSYFHSTEAAHLRGAFEGVERVVEEKLYRRLISLVTEHACGGAVAFITSEKEFDQSREGKSWEYSQYTTCAYACIQLLQGEAEKLGDEQIRFTIERGHKDESELNRLLSNLCQWESEWSFGFDSKKIRPLQTADLWAYETWKRVREQFKKSPRKLRTSLRVLVEGVPNMQTIWLNRKSLPVLFNQVRTSLSNQED